MKVKIVFRILLGIILTIPLAIGIGLYLVWHNFLNTPIIPVGQKLIYVFPQGATITDLADFLHTHANLKHPKYLIWLAETNGAVTQLQAGEYELKSELLPQQILNKIKYGEVIHHKITLVEGWNFNQIRHALNEAPRLTHTLNKLSPAAIMLHLKSKYTYPEGLFFPDTYLYTMNTTDFAILQKAYNRMQKQLDKAWSNRAANLPYKNSYQALIVASMLEKEAKLARERQLIAGIIVNRIHKNMFLQIDPTIIYALGKKYKGKLTTRDLHIISSYNTYLYKGLPPTPIAMPSEQSLEAALHPTQTGYFYYVAKGDGSHYFSSTLKQHNTEIKEYIQNGKVDVIPSIKAKTLSLFDNLK